MGKPIREFESRPLRKQKGDTKSVALIVCRKPSSACGRKADGEQLGGLAEQRPFLFARMPAAAKRYSISPSSVVFFYSIFCIFAVDFTVNGSYMNRERETGASPVQYPLL